ncbi:MAG: cation diffusion facilitator family transporter [Acidimicrobiia bacterium]
MSGSHDHSPRRPHGHGHDHVGSRTAARNVGRLWIALGLTISFVVVEAVAAFLTGSLALLSDAGHMLADGAAIALALGAIVVASKASHEGARTFGLFRLEILASLANALLLFAVAGYVFVEAIIRLVDGSSHVDAGPMLLVAIGGLVVNVVVFALLRDGARGSLAVKSAYVEALADMAGSAGVIAAAVVIAVTGWDPIDPIVAVAISIWIIPRAWSLAGSALRVLLQVAPAHIDLDAVTADLSGIDGVVDVHDLHVWTLTSEMDVASAHMMITPATEPHAVLDQARALLERHGIEHATIQVEPDDHEGCAELDW